VNIFVTDECPRISAKNLCDRHVPKMVLESAQMLSNAFHKLGDAMKAPYRMLMIKHPCSVWTLESRQNYEWLLEHAFAISDEYTKRYNKTHACLKVLQQCKDGLNDFRFESHPKTSYKQVMPLIYRNSSTIYAYRSYIKGAKSFAKWEKGTDKPSWYNSHVVTYDLNGVQSYMEREIPVPLI
jgi:Pyrimidine dimer DNA glycosylase